MEPSLTKALISAIAGLSGAIVALFYWFRDRFAKMEKERDAALAGQAKLQTRLDNLNTLVGWFKICPIQRCPYFRVKEVIEEAEQAEEQQSGSAQCALAPMVQPESLPPCPPARFSPEFIDRSTSPA